MSKIWITSDWHFNHDRAFVWHARGFNSVEEMNEAIIERHNSLVAPDDEVYVLGDLCLGGGEWSIMQANRALIERLNGHLHIVIGNHDTQSRIEMYMLCDNVETINYAEKIKYNGYHFFMTHFPCMTANLEKESLKQCTISLHGHTHSKNHFYMDTPFLYQVGMDAHNCYPVLLDDAIEDMKNEVKKCKEQL